MRIESPFARIAASLLGFALAARASAATPAPLPPHRSATDIAKAVAAAPARFAIREVPSVPPAEAAAQLWPQRGRFFDEPIVLRDDKGAAHLAERTLAPENVPSLHIAEEHFRAERYDAALPLYEQAAAKDPACFDCWNGAGDCHYFSGRGAPALRAYRKATDANPFGHRSWFYAGKVLAEAGYPEEALQPFAIALTLRPDWKTLLDYANHEAEKLKVDVHAEPLLDPPGFVRKDGEKVTLVVASGAPAHWRTYLECKALWRAEPDGCDVCPPGQKAGFRFAEERECVAALLDAYANRGAAVPPEPRLERLASVARAGLLDAFLLYELAPRNVPSATLLVERDARVLVGRYVQAYVLVPRQR